MKLQNGLALLCGIVGIVLAFASGDPWFVVIGVGAGLAIVLFKRLLRTLLWVALGAYGAFIMPPNGWFFVLLGCIVCMSLPWTRGITPVADFSKPKG